MQEMAHSGIQHWTSMVGPVRSANLTVGSLCGHPGGCRLQTLALLLQDAQLDNLEGLMVMWDAPRTAKPAGAALVTHAGPVQLVVVLSD